MIQIRRLSRLVGREQKTIRKSIQVPCIQIKQNTLNIYNTYKLDPFGKNARCGGLGCDLGKGALVATLKFEPKGSSFIVREASGKAGFLTGARCRIVDGYAPVLECASNKSPASSNMQSVFRFAPGS
jgi:hypothetical protein